ncbi:phytanoyl-CoA dioxygenase PhyH [Kribbella voronezhensis]|uniref:Phytanoyl-CoA dioxygenase PhyH n=1 Tax=Kribbella voronezhensis TaxID=2512212 RepID=A0A4R7SYF4_9ACTN|nr:phytanoyl-CoA dioxygenase family protein [Kribbella voronezhensis]TDU84420.1 phytanoyl-CoA dioxygenase PhyH [Kribbella voronezhensis]
MLSDSQLEEFTRDGIVRIPAAFSAEDANRMRNVLWRELGELYGMRRDNRSTWAPVRPTNLVASKKDSAANAILGPPLRSALDQLLGPAGWSEPPHQGQVLVTLPTDEPWSLPHRQWHTDVGFEIPQDELIGVKVWALLGDLEPGGGGTPQVAGSHRVIARYLTTTEERDFKAVRDQVLASHPWFRQLTRKDRAADLVSETDLDGIPVRVVELVGQAGDVYLTHPWVLHSIAPNARDTPRMMRSRMMWRNGWPR